MENTNLYFKKGAYEVMICDEYGDLTFYNSKARMKKSKMFPEFPNKIEI